MGALYFSGLFCRCYFLPPNRLVIYTIAFAGTKKLYFIFSRVFHCCRCWSPVEIINSYYRLFIFLLLSLSIFFIYFVLLKNFLFLSIAFILSMPSCVLSQTFALPSCAHSSASNFYLRCFWWTCDHFGAKLVFCLHYSTNDFLCYIVNFLNRLFIHTLGFWCTISVFIPSTLLKNAMAIYLECFRCHLIIWKLSGV